MRTNIEIDDKLMRDALAASGLPTKKAAIEEALRLYVQMKALRAIIELAAQWSSSRAMTRRRGTSNAHKRRDQ